MATEPIQFLWQREDHMKVRHAEQFLLALIESALTRLRLALVAVPVAAGVIGDGLLTTLRASIHVPAQRCCAAVLHGAQHTQLLIAEPGSILLDEAVALRVE